MDLFFNELCLEPIASSQSEARIWMNDFVRALAAAINHGVRPVLRADRDLYPVILSQDYRIYNWVNDRAVEREHRSLLKSLSLKVPHLAETAPNTVESALGCDGFFSGARSQGLTAAYVCDGVATSLLSKPCWDSAHIQIALESIEADEISAEPVTVRHISRSYHALVHKPWIDQKRLSLIKDGADLWRQKERVFPGLKFCESVRHVTEEMGGNHLCFQLLVKRLHDLHNMAKKEGPFGHSALDGNARQESESTLAKYGKERTFRCPDGISRMFSWHLNLPNGWRLYYEPDAGRKTVSIGYIGKHLPTVQFPK